MECNTAKNSIEVFFAHNKNQQFEQATKINYQSWRSGPD